MAESNINQLAQQVHAVQKHLALVPLEQRNLLLQKIGESLEKHRERIFSANREDLERSANEKVSAPLLSRLKFDQQKLDSACEGIAQIASLPDPVGAVRSSMLLDDGLNLSQESCPIGVIGMIFESRPDALIQIASLCLKSGNGIILKGGSEALETNRVLTSIIREASIGVLPEVISDKWILLLESRADVSEMLKLDQSIDLLIPRGSNQFVRYIMDHTSIPVLGHADGICHAYVAPDANLEMAVNVVVDSKCQYPAACNTIETILINSNCADRVTVPICKALGTAGVEIRGDEQVRELYPCAPATKEDWSTEYLDLIVSIRIVDSTAEAVEHINTYGSGHTDTIITDNSEDAEYFLGAVDSADVFWNCSTRFADGFRYGLGAEVGISTHKIHARGPVGLEGLVSYKWKLRGAGQVVADYTGPQAKNFKHIRLDESR
jgi:glutamate-5-semialdehyde dehydrogenase